MARKAFLFSLLTICTIALTSCEPGETGTLARVKKDKRVYVGTVPFEAPLLYQDRQELVGPEARLAAQLASKIGEQAGHPSAEIFWITRTYKTLTPALANGEIDFVIAVFGVTDEREQQIAFSKPYYQSELVLATNPAHKDLSADELDGLKVAVRADTAAEQKVRSKYAGSEIVPLATVDDAVLALKRGEVDALIDDKYMIAFSLATTPGVANLEIVPGTLETVPVAVGVRKGEEGVLAAVNQLIDEVLAGDQYAAWTKEQFGPQLQAVLDRHENRLQRIRAQKEPRSVTIRVTKDSNSTFDIYRFANLNFVLTNQNDGKSYSTSRINFSGSTGLSRVSVPPGTYRVYMPKFNFTAGTFRVSTGSASSIGVRILFRSDGTFVMSQT